MWAVLNKDRAGTIAACGFESPVKLTRSDHREALNPEAQLQTSSFGLPEGVGPASIAFRRIPEDRHVRHGGKRFFEECEPFAAEFGDQTAQPGDIPPRSREARDEPGAERIGNVHENNRDCVRRHLSRQSRTRGHRKNHVNLEADQLGRKVTKAIEVPFGVAGQDGHVFAFAVAQRAQPLDKRRPEIRCRSFGWGRIGEKTDPPDLSWRLRLSWERQCENAPTHQSDERSPVHYWMISSARTRTD